MYRVGERVSLAWDADRVGEVMEIRDGVLLVLIDGVVWRLNQPQVRSMNLLERMAWAATGLDAG